MEAAATIEALTKVIEEATKVQEAAIKVVDGVNKVVSRMEDGPGEVPTNNIADFTLKEPAIMVTSALFFILKIIKMEDMKVMGRDMEVLVGMPRTKTDK